MQLAWTQRCEAWCVTHATLLCGTMLPVRVCAVQHSTFFVVAAVWWVEILQRPHSTLCSVSGTGPLAHCCASQVVMRIHRTPLSAASQWLMSIEMSSCRCGSGPTACLTMAPAVRRTSRSLGAHCVSLLLSCIIIRIVMFLSAAGLKPDQGHDLT